MPQSNPKNVRIKLLLLFAVFATPFIASYLAYYFWTPTRFSNYGELIKTQPLPELPLLLLNGAPYNLSQLRGKWVMLQVDDAQCAENCREKMYALRQVRLAQGKEQDRIERVWVVQGSGQPSDALLHDYSGTKFVRADKTLIGLLPVQDKVEDHIYLIDPLGNLMMRYSKKPDARKMIKDIRRLLKASSIG